jgi:hypothetical protein
MGHRSAGPAGGEAIADGVVSKTEKVLVKKLRHAAHNHVAAPALIMFNLGGRITLGPTDNGKCHRKGVTV